MIPNWETIDELRNIFIENYTQSKLSTELEKACSEEYELMRDYNGRQILELLQNVDDAYEENSSNGSVINIKFLGGILEVGNTGTSFSSETIERLCLGRASDKSSSNIGNKGTGFRSLLNDAEWIEIHSGNFSIRFSSDYANKLFDEFVDKKSAHFSELLYEQLNNWKKEYPLSFPIMNCPEQIQRLESRFDTLIRLKIKDGNFEKETSIEKQLNQQFYRSVLFLPNITQIIIETAIGKKIYSKDVIEKQRYKHVFIKENDNKPEEYYVFEKSVDVTQNKKATIIIAYPLDPNYSFDSEKLYCYFPIRNFNSPIHALIHAPFITNSSRDDIPHDNDQINKRIFEHTIVFIKEISEQLKTINHGNPIKFVSPLEFSKGKLWNADAFDLKDYYLDTLCDAHILPTVNNTFISINDVPKIISSFFPDEFKGKGFETLISHNLGEEVYSFLYEWSKIRGLDNTFAEEELCNSINEHQDEFDVKTQVRLFLWWSAYFQNSKHVPNLLKDTSNNWVTNNSRVFLPTDTGISTLDSSLSWVNLCILNQEYVDEMVLLIKKDFSKEWQKVDEKNPKSNTKRILDAYSDSNLAIKFIEQGSSERIVGEIIKQVDTFEHSVSFINWFFENYRDKLAQGSELSKSQFKLPGRDNLLHNTSSLYFGQEYGNGLADKLFNETNFLPITKMANIYKGEDKKEFVDFLNRCGVLFYPQIKYFSQANLFYDFISYIKKKNNIVYQVNAINVLSIDDFKKLISTLGTSEITKWITEDEQLANLIVSSKEECFVKQRSNWQPDRFKSNEYIIYVLNETPWIELEGKKYSPKEIIKYGKIRNYTPDIYGIQEKDLIALLSENIVSKYCLSFRDSFASFDDKLIKKLLDELPRFDTGEISRKFYLDIIEKKKDCLPTYSTNGLELLAKDGKFYLNTELVYVDKKMPQEIDKSKTINIPTKRGIEIIEKWFGVKKVKSNLELSSFKILEDKSLFDEEIKDIKVSILSTLDVTANYIDKIKHTGFVPCTHLKAFEKENNNHEIYFDDYSIIKKEGNFYIKVPSPFDAEIARKSHEFATSIIEAFCDSVSSQIDIDLVELLISKSPKEKRQKLEEKFGIDMWNNSFKLLFSGSNVSKMIIEYFNSIGLSEELKEKISLIDFSSSLSSLNYEVLFAILEESSKDISDLNAIHEMVNIDVREYIKALLKEYVNSKRNIYEASCYKSAFNGDDFAKRKFLKKMRNYCHPFEIDDNEIENSIHNDFDKLLSRHFPDYDSKSEEMVGTIKCRYDSNYQSLISMNISKEDLDLYLENNIGDNSMLYFNVPEDLIARINEYLQKENNSSPLVSKNNMPTVNLETSTINVILEKDYSRSNQNPLGNPNKGEQSSKGSRKRSANNEAAGNEAEGIANSELKKTYRNMIWHSKNTDFPSERNKLPPNNIVCDMWNHGEQGNTYFEVKSSVDEFEMPISEYQSMKENPDNYYVVLVDRTKRAISLHKFNALSPLKEPCKYKFIFKQKPNL